MRVLTVLFTALSFFHSTNSVAEVNLEQLVKNIEKVAYYAGEDGRAQARMLIVDSQGRKQYRQFTILRKDVEDNADQKLMVFFTQPSDVRNTVFRVEKHAKLTQEDDRWLYLPALDLVKRISAGDKRTSFVGSHFFYEDVSGRATAEDTFELISEDDESYLLKATPKEPSSVEFHHFMAKIDKATLLPITIEFYDDKQVLYRQVQTIKHDIIQGYPTVLRSQVSDLRTGGYTLMEFRQPEYDLGLPDDIFSERSLRTLPKAWLP